MAKSMKILGRILRIFAAVICGLGMAAILFITYYYFFGQEEASVPGQTVQVHMRSDLTPTVHYRDNMVFPPGPQPADVQFLTNFTEFIEAKSSFRASFTRPVNVAYRFQATATLVVRGDGGGVLHREIIVLEEDFDDLENVTSIYNFTMRRNGNVYDDFAWDLSWFEEEHPPDWDHSPEDEQIIEIVIIEGNLPGGIVQVDVMDFWEIVHYMMQDISEGMGQFLGHTAELEVEFSHRIFVRNYNLDETITRSLVVPIRRDTYNFATTGAATHTATGRLDPRAILDAVLEGDDSPDIAIDIVEWLIYNENVSEEFVIYFGLMLIPLFAAGIYFSVGGVKLLKILVRYLRRLIRFTVKHILKVAKGTGSSYEKKVNKLLKKYANEIVEVSSSLKREDLVLNHVAEFGDLLKLALFTNHPIFCYNDTEKKNAEFSVVFEGYLHCFMVFGEVDEEIDGELQSA